MTARARPTIGRVLNCCMRPDAAGGLPRARAWRTCAQGGGRLRGAWEGVRDAGRAEGRRERRAAAGLRGYGVRHEPPPC